MNINEDEEHTLTVSFSDVDEGDTLSASVSSTSGISVSVISSTNESAEILIDSDDDYYGTASVTVTIADGGDSDVESNFNVSWLDNEKII